MKIIDSAIVGYRIVKQYKVEIDDNRTVLMHKWTDGEYDTDWSAEPSEENLKIYSELTDEESDRLYDLMLNEKI